MPFAPRGRKPLAIAAAVIAASTGLALSPLGLSAATASDSSSAATIVADVNSYRASHSSAAALLTNAFLTSNAQDYANYFAKHDSFAKDPTKFTLPFPSNPDSPDSNDETGWVVKVPHGTATSTFDFLETQDIESSFADSGVNYVSVGYAKHNTTVFAIIFFDHFDTAPYNLITESTPTISGSDHVGKTLTATAKFSRPTSDVTVNYTWFTSTTQLQSGTSPTLVVPAAAYDHRIYVTVTGSESGYVASDDETTTLTKTSSKTSDMGKGTITKGTVSVTGTRAVGAILTVNPGTWAPSSVVLTYTWLRNGKAISGFTNVTGTSYTLTSADLGKVINVEVTGKSTNFTTATHTTGSSTKTTGPTD